MGVANDPSTTAAVDSYPAWLGVAKSPAERPAFYAVTIRDIKLERPIVTEPIRAAIKFESDDNVNDILKVVRANEVWGKKVDIAIVFMLQTLFSEFRVLNLDKCTFDLVDKRDGLSTWEIGAESVTHRP